MTHAANNDPSAEETPARVVSGGLVRQMGKLNRTDTEFYAYVSGSGNIIPSTIREKAGDSESALRKTYGVIYGNDKLSNCTLGRVRVTLLPNASGQTRPAEPL